ncbi:MAG TPA: CpaF family protein [Candidatus Aenigmarchaeota archaeon]|nr:CpaF family protein [Candidatus Aenigmarchaeota archaeon]
MKKKDKKSINEEYEIDVYGLPAHIKIYHKSGEFVPSYIVEFPKIEPATQAVLDAVRERIITEMPIKMGELSSPEEGERVKREFMKRAKELIKYELPSIDKKMVKMLSGILVQNSLGLGPLEIMINDKNLEEIVVNSAREPVWVYHRKYGWLKTNIILESENVIYNYADMTGRRVGMQINNLNPLMDAYLTTGDRVNATLFPISSKGNTLTIRKFARKAWTMTDFISLGTISLDAAAFLWCAIQYELNIVVAGGTALGKTSLLNALTIFIPPNQRIISIEDTREIQLPEFLHWVPMTTRQPNPEGKGEVTMLQLMINALRMRPDRILVGEIRRSREAEVLFEAIHTGHSVYSTLHANTAEEAYRRLTNPPINIPPSLLESLQLIAVMHRDRRRGIRRVLEISELLVAGGLGQIRIELNDIFRWVPSEDKIIQIKKSQRVSRDIKLFTGMDEHEFEEDLLEKKLILKWMVKNNVNDINKVGYIVSTYYSEPEKVMKMIKDERKV